MDKQQLSNVCFTASLASVLVSIATWVLISPEDPAHGERFALFIGLWAPTLMGLANYYKEQEYKMNGIEFLFALGAVTLMTSVHILWTAFVYRLDNPKEELKTDLTEQPERI